MQDNIKILIHNRRHCVLATSAGDVPYCSLMAYTTDNTGTRFFMVTLRNSRKYKNIVDNPRVSLLIDSREVSPRSNQKALTIEGVCAAIKSEEKRKAVQAKLLGVHPHLSEFISHPKAEILCVRIHSFLLLHGLQKAHYESV